jgi:TRAP-type C4-dicarboxylate transport system substrate-binding protein
MTNAVSRRAVLGRAATILAAPALVGRAKAATALKVSTSFPNDPKFSTARIWYDLFLPRLKAATDGQVTTLFFPDNQLGQEADVINQVKMGVVDMTLIGTSIWANIVPEFGVFDLGYVFDDYDHMRRAAATPAGVGYAFSVVGPQPGCAQFPDEICLHRSGRSGGPQDPLPAHAGGDRDGAADGGRRHADGVR